MRVKIKGRSNARLNKNKRRAGWGSSGTEPPCGSEPASGTPGPTVILKSWRLLCSCGHSDSAPSFGLFPLRRFGFRSGPEAGSVQRKHGRINKRVHVTPWSQQPPRRPMNLHVDARLRDRDAVERLVVTWREHVTNAETRPNWLLSRDVNSRTEKVFITNDNYNRNTRKRNGTFKTHFKVYRIGQDGPRGI